VGEIDGKASSQSQPQPQRVWHSLRAGLAETFAPPRSFAPAVETEFLHDYGNRFLWFRRSAAFLALCMWTSFLRWDFTHHRDQPAIFDERVFEAVLTLRFAGIGLLLTMCLTTLHRSFSTDRWAHVVLQCGVVAAAGCLIAMVVVVPQPLNYIYYFVGLYLVLIFQFGFLHLRAWPTLYMAAGIFAVLLTLQLLDFLGGMRFMAAEHFEAGTFYFVSVCVIGFGISVKLERDARVRFSHERHLHAQNLALAEQEKSNQLKADALVQLSEAQRKLAEKANHEKSEFLAKAVHDIRNNMHATGLFLDPLDKALSRNDLKAASSMLASLRKSVRQMNNSANATLELSRLESGHTAPQYADFDLAELIELLVDEVARFAETRNVTLRQRVRTGIVAVRSDREMLLRILKNLVTNAVKYARPQPGGQSCVIIGVVALPSRVRVHIVDNGIGIPKADFGRIFQPFEQLNNPQRDRERGQGLGLSIVNALVNLLDQHRIELTSTPGVGSRFSVDIPLGMREAVEARLTAAQDEHDMAFSLEGKYVLLVEDDPLVSEATRALLLAWGVQVDSAPSVEAFEKLVANLERYPDAVITDFHLPNGRTAVDVMRLVKAHCTRESTGKHAPVLMVSGETSLPEARELAGISTTLAKPVSPDVLRRSLSEAIRAN
jgi:two-component system, sensor histidine kinase